jgi:hypothetical protein
MFYPLKITRHIKRCWALAPPCAEAQQRGFLYLAPPCAEAQQRT